jgi:ABC-type microcin C transport system duplicated ATPase subunit YejF
MNSASQNGRPLLEVRGLKKWFPIQRGSSRKTVGHVKAVDGVSFTLNAGETLGLVGESGCGKTTAGRTLLRLLDPTEGYARFGDLDVFELEQEDLRQLRRKMQIIFQDPYSSLNPRMTVAGIVGESLRVHGIVDTPAQARERVEQLLERVRAQSQIREPLSARVQRRPAAAYRRGARTGARS